MTANVKPFLTKAGLGLALLALLACGGSAQAPANNPPPSTAGAMDVRLVDSPSSQFQEINLDIQKVEIHQSGSASESGWITLGTPNRNVNLLTLTGGISETLVAGASLPPGQYEQMRLLLGAGNTVKLQDGSTVELKVPSGLQSGLKLPGSFIVAAGTTSDVFIDFDAAHSIQLKTAGSSSQFILRPVVKAFDKAVTGSISGTLTANGAPLAGALVMAETVDASGNVSIARSVTTSSSGTYYLDLLPVGQPYFVVSQPVSGGVSYDAQASGSLMLSPLAPVQVYNATFMPATGEGTVSGSISPVATTDQSDTVYLMQSLSTGGSGQATLIVRSAVAVVGPGETYAFASVPANVYTVLDVRMSMDSSGGVTVVRSPLSASFQVLAGLVATVGISL